MGYEPVNNYITRYSATVNYSHTSYHVSGETLTKLCVMIYLGD